ncbi:transcription-repair coupling factor [Chlamydiota bacterium]
MSLSVNSINILIAQIIRKREISIAGLWNSSKSFLIASLGNKTANPLVVVVKDKEVLDTISEDLFFFSQKNILRFPSWETLPHDRVSPHKDIIRERFMTLHALSQGNISDNNPIVVTEIQAIMHKIIGKESFKKKCLQIAPNDDFGQPQLIEFLTDNGFERAAVVESRGEWVLRGSIVDIYPLDSDLPLRIEFSDDEIVSLRQFDPSTQKSLTLLQQWTLIPVQEIDYYNTQKEINVTLFDYLSQEAIIVFNELDEIKNRYDELCSEHSIASPFQVPFEDIVKNRIEKKVFLSELREDYLDEKDTFYFPIKRVSSLLGSDYTLKMNEHIDLFFSIIKQKIEEQYSLYFVANNEGEKERLEEYLAQNNIAGNKCHIIIGRVSSGFVIEKDSFMILTDHELFRRYKIRYSRKKIRDTKPITVFSQLNKGDFVVHSVQGIGKFLGTVIWEEEGKKGEYLQIEYLDKAKLYVPIDQIALVQKYIGVKEHRPKLDKLGTSSWKRKKEKVTLAVLDFASELIKTQAARKTSVRTPFSLDATWQKEFEDAFIYQETHDQISAIDEVKKDMVSPNPMDRLICGDVGYGKTEVAIRAAFKAALDSRQTVLLVPTTILAQQHFRTFTDRMADYPIAIEMLSRFRNHKEQKDIIKKIHDGSIDIVIGTHRILQQDILFKNLGLVIIDEEQRFGVKSKEKLKKMKQLIDVLILSATPIPRTLYLSLMHARDMSVIDTPPEDRLPVETILAPYSELLIREAILREISRGGQVYFVHNRIITIHLVKKQLMGLFPNITIEIAHGRMAEEELSQVMDTFLNGEIQVLLCTTIIESGMDIPNVNTIIIDQAEKFGLADLYQLRGRVGRFKRRAFAYILYSRGKRLLPDAKKRLKAIEDFTELGSGFKIAMRDLEIRGAGNVLGKQQHGHIITVGFRLYLDLLEQAIVRLKGIEKQKEKKVLINIGVIPSIPVSYIEIEQLRLQIYARLMNVVLPSELNEIKEEILDRFGPLPEEMELVFLYAFIVLLAKQKNISAIESKKNRLIIKDSRGIRSVDTIEELLVGGRLLLYLERIKKILQKM